MKKLPPYYGLPTNTVSFYNLLYSAIKNKGLVRDDIHTLEIPIVNIKTKIYYKTPNVVFIDDFDEDIELSINYKEILHYNKWIYPIILPYLKELVAKSKVVEIHPNAIKIGEGENKVRKIPETFEEEKKRKDHIIVFRTFVAARIFNKIYAVKFLLRYAYKIKKDNKMELYTMELMPRIKYEEIQEREGLLLQQAIASRHSVSTNTQSHISATKLLKNFGKTHHYIDKKNKIRVKILDYQNTYYELPEQYRTKQYKKEYKKMQNLSGLPWTISHHNGRTIYTYNPEKGLGRIRDYDFDKFPDTLALTPYQLKEGFGKYPQGTILVEGHKQLDSGRKYYSVDSYINGKKISDSHGIFERSDDGSYYFLKRIPILIGDVFAKKSDEFVIVDIEDMYMAVLRHRYYKNTEYRVPVSELFDVFYFRLKCYDYRPTLRPLQALYLEYCHYAEKKGAKSLKSLEKNLNLQGLDGSTTPYQVGDIIKLYGDLWDGSLYQVTRAIDRVFFIRELNPKTRFSETKKVELEDFPNFDLATLQQLELCLQV